MKQIRFSLLLCVALLATATYAQSTYHWTGAVNQHFSTAGNWNPTRQVGLVTDILMFDNGIVNTIDNVNQVTVGKLLFQSNTTVYLSPGTGNSRTIFIHGTGFGTSPDVLVENGSSLIINSTDPDLNISFLTGTNGNIAGLLKFNATLSAFFDAVDENTIVVTSTGTLWQNSPGHLFRNFGQINIITFNDGATMIVEGAALSPFGFTNRESKVIFSTLSKFTFTGSIATPNDFFAPGIGLYGDMVITPNCTVALDAISISLNAHILYVNSNATFRTTNCTGSITLFCNEWLGTVKINPGVTVNIACIDNSDGKDDKVAYTIPKTLTKIIVYDILGREVFSSMSSTSLSPNDIKNLNLPSGIYIIKSLYNDKSFVVNKTMIYK